MSISLNDSDFKSLVDVLSHLSSEFALGNERRALVEYALAGGQGGTDLMGKIDFTIGPADDFITDLVSRLALLGSLPDGQEPLLVFIEGVMVRFGEADNDYAVLEGLLDKYSRMAPGLPGGPGNLNPAYFLIDREDQAREFEAVFERSGRPDSCLMAFLVHGGNNQRQDLFTQRLEDYQLRKVLGLGERMKVTFFRLSFPGKLRRADDLAGILRREWVELFELPDEAGLQEVQNKLSELRGPVLVETEFNYHDHERVWYDALQAYFRFWDGWPELSPGQRLFVVLSVYYQAKEKQGGLLRILSKSPRDKILQYVQSEFSSQTGNICRAALPQLDGANETEATNWVYRRENHRHFNIRRVAAELKRFYREQAANRAQALRVPLDDLIVELEELADKYRSTNREMP